MQDKYELRLSIAVSKHAGTSKTPCTDESMKLEGGYPGKYLSELLAKPSSKASTISFTYRTQKRLKDTRCS